MKIKLSFKYHASNHWPSFRVWFNELCLVDLEDTSCAPVDFMFDVMPKYPMEHNELVIEQYGKLINDTVIDEQGTIIKDRAIEIVSISIDEFDQPRSTIVAKKFWPIWPEHMTNMPDYISDQMYLGFNGKYRFDFPANVGQDYYDKLWDQERELNNRLTQVDENNEAWFTAYGLKLRMNEKFDFDLTRLKNLIEQNENR